MNFKQQLQEAYKAGYNSSLNEQQYPSNPYPPDSIDHLWWERMHKIEVLLQTGPQGLELYRNDLDGDGEITFNDLLLLLEFFFILILFFFLHQSEVNQFHIYSFLLLFNSNHTFQLIHKIYPIQFYIYYQENSYYFSF